MAHISVVGIKENRMDGIFIATNIHCIVWSFLKAIFLTLLLFHLFYSVLSYPAFPENGGFLESMPVWLSSFVSTNWPYLIAVFILYYSWATHRTVKSMSERVEQLEVIALSQIKYFDYWPITDVGRTTSFKELVNNSIAGWFYSLFGLNNPKDLPWSAKPVCKGEEVKIRDACLGNHETDDT